MPSTDFCKTLRGLLEKATPAPWLFSKMTRNWMIRAAGKFGGRGPMAKASVKWHVAMMHGGAPGDHDDAVQSNAELVVILRNHAEAILALVEAARDAYEYGYDRAKMEKALAALDKEA